MFCGKEKNSIANTDCFWFSKRFFFKCEIFLLKKQIP